MESIFVNNEKINVIVKNSKRSKNVTIHFEEKSMIVKKPTRISLKKVDKIIKQNMEKIAKLYLKYKENGAIKIKYKNNEKIMFFGNIYNIKIILTELKNENIKNISETSTKITGRAILQLTDDMTLIKRYDTIAQAVRETGVNSKSIRDAAKGVQKHAGGYVWKYADEIGD